MSELNQQQVAALPDAVKKQGLALLARMSPEGMLGLPKLLDSRRMQYGIPDGAFAQKALFDRVLVFQIPDRTSSTYEQGGLIEMPDNVKAANLYRAPVGIIVSAGLNALDALVSNGCQVGDKVQFVKNAPYFVRVDTIGGKDFNLVVLTAGELIGNFDLQDRLKRREMFEVQNPLEPGRAEHVFKKEDGSFLLPQPAWREES
jgi:hypothetical protein